MTASATKFWNKSFAVLNQGVSKSHLTVPVTIKKYYQPKQYGKDYYYEMHKMWTMYNWQ